MQVAVLGPARAGEEQESREKSWAGHWNAGGEVGAEGRCERDRRGSTARPSSAAAATG